MYKLTQIYSQSNYFNIFFLNDFSSVKFPTDIKLNLLSLLLKCIKYAINQLFFEARVNFIRTHQWNYILDRFHYHFSVLLILIFKIIYDPWNNFNRSNLKQNTLSRMQGSIERINGLFNTIFWQKMYLKIVGTWYMNMNQRRMRGGNFFPNEGREFLGIGWKYVDTFSVVDNYLQWEGSP